MSHTKWNREVHDRTTDGLALVRDLDWAYTAKLARPVYDPWAGSGREYVWTDDAACRGVNPELFQVSQVGDPGLEGISTRHLRDLNDRKVQDAQKYCESCPVKKTCRATASESDLYWSVRGGEVPTILVPLPGGGKAKPPAFPLDDYVDWTCASCGHDATLMRKRDGQSLPYCGSCADA